MNSVCQRRAIRSLSGQRCGFTHKVGENLSLEQCPALLDEKISNKYHRRTLFPIVTHQNDLFYVGCG